MELDYGVCLSDFQGPIDALRDAARRQDVALSRVDLSALIRDFGYHVRDRSDWNVHGVSAYLLVFSELIRIKTRLLLPDEEEDESTEPEPGEDADEDLIALAARTLRERARRRARMYEGHPPRLPDEVTAGETHYREVTLVELIRSFQKLMQTEREPRTIDLKITDEFDTEERMDYIMETLSGPRPRPFEQFLSARPSREEIVVTLLAILQLVKGNDLRLLRPVEGGTIRLIKVTSEDRMRETA